MKKQQTDEKRQCPKCGAEEEQINAGYNRSGTQRCVYMKCKHKYTPSGKNRVYLAEIREQAIKTYYSGVSGRGVGKLFGMSKANVYNWIKKTNKLWISQQTACDIFELDELYWFVGCKGQGESRENVYVMTMTSREPRQIVGFSVAADKSRERIQGIVDSAPDARKYCTDGYLGYIDIVYPGQHIRNVQTKNDTFTVEGINADIRHYIPVLARKSRCFCRKIETLEAVLSVFINAYNKFGEAKLKYRIPSSHKSPAPDKHLHKYRDLPFSFLDFL